MLLQKDLISRYSYDKTRKIFIYRCKIIYLSSQNRGCKLNKFFIGNG